jgi:predicted nucleic acid-binding protein
VAHYLDTSAPVKLVVAEPETEALRAWLADTDSEWVSNNRAQTELMRAVRRSTPERRSEPERFSTPSPSSPSRRASSTPRRRLDPLVLRTLDAVHLAAALDRVTVSRRS